MKALTLGTLALALTLGAGCEKKKAEEAAQKVVEAAKAVGETLAEGAKTAGKKIAAGAEAAWDATKSGAKYVGEKVSAGAQVVAAGAKESWITAKIKAKMLGKLFSVSVTTQGTKVTLTGTAKTQAEKDEVEKIARTTEGVTEVVNQIQVVP